MVKNAEYVTSLQSRRSCYISPAIAKEVCRMFMSHAWIRWLTEKNIRKCELCKEPFNLSEEFGSIWFIFKKNIKYLMDDKRRIIKLFIYGLYMYLFSKRVISLLTYFKRIILKTLFIWRKQEEASGKIFII